MVRHRGVEKATLRCFYTCGLITVFSCISDALSAATLVQEVGNQSFVIYAVENKNAADVQRLLAPLFLRPSARGAVTLIFDLLHLH